MIIKQDTCTRMKLLYLHVVIKSLILVLKTGTSGNPQMFLTGLELALGNGETCLWIYSNVENIRLLIDFCFFVLVHMIIMGQKKLEMSKRTFVLLKQSCLPG